MCFWALGYFDSMLCLHKDGLSPKMNSEVPVLDRSCVWLKVLIRQPLCGLHHTGQNFPDDIPACPEIILLMCLWKFSNSSTSGPE